jgi:nitroreductase
MATTVVTIAIVLVAGLAFQALRAWLQMRGTRLVTCPETRAAAAVEVDLGHLALTSAAGLRELRLRNCSRWPEKKNCGQMCLTAIEEAPHDCLVREVVRRWFDGKACTFCGRPIAPVRWHDHKPAFKAADDRIWECHEIPAEQLPAFMAGARAVCWSCMIVEGFRHDHPDLVVERPRPTRPATHH